MSGDASNLVDNLTFAEMLSGGWNVLGHYAVQGAYTGNYDIQDPNADPSTLKASSYWLVGAYVSGLGGDCHTINVATCSGYIGSGQDHFKLSAVGGIEPDDKLPDVDSLHAPEPMTALLLAGGLPLMLWRRRR